MKTLYALEQVQVFIHNALALHKKNGLGGVVEYIFNTIYDEELPLCLSVDRTYTCKTLVSTTYSLW